MAPTPSELQSIRRSVNDWRKISDRLFQVGPLKVGLDGMLTWIPGVGDAYGLGASAYLLAQASRAGASAETITKMAVLLGVDAVVGSVPVVGDLFDMVFRAHARAARVLTEEIDRIHTALPAPDAYSGYDSGPARTPAAPRPTPWPDIDLRTPPHPPAAPAPPGAPPRAATPPSPLRPSAPAPPPEIDEESEWEQARRVEELRAQYRDRGGGIDRRRR